MSFATGRAVPALLAVVVTTALAPAQPPKAASIPDRLAQRVDAGAFDGTFKEAVKLLTDKYDLPLVVDRSLVQDEDGALVAEKPVKLPKLSNVRLDTVLGLACEQVNAMYLVEPDRIRVVRDVNGFIEAGVWQQPDPADPNAEESPLPLTDRYKYRPAIKRALVNAAFKAKPLAEVVDAIADATGANVVLAPQAAEAAKLPVTVRFANTPVDAAVRTLCELADLGVIEDANVLIVTTRERAAAKAKADAEKRKARQLEAGLVGLGGGGFGGLGGAGGGIGLPGDGPADVAKLKEQNEELKKQLDEVLKLLKK